MKDNDDIPDNFEVLFLQGVHFYHLNNYYTNLINHLSIFTFANFEVGITKIINLPIQQKKVIYQVSDNSLCKKFFAIEQRIVQNDLIEYWFVRTLQEVKVGQKSHCQITLKSEIQMAKNPKDNKSAIKAKIHYSSTLLQFPLFEVFKNLKNKYVLFKDNYCQNNRYGQILYPYPRINSQYDQNHGKSDMILLLNQNNLRQMPFFLNLLINLTKKGKRIDKIIGHPSSLFLCFLYDKNREVNPNIAKILLNYDRQPQYRQSFSNRIQKSKIIKGFLLKTFTQQNIINPNLVEFIVDNIVTEQFIEDFTTLVQLYYKIFLQTDLTKQEIQSSFYNFFYEQQQIIQRQCFKFSSLLHLVEFKQNIWVNQLIKRMIHHLPNKFVKIQQITLQDLFELCQIEFTFVALDLTDKIVRFFNHKTAPKMPIIAILSLIQFLPLPYKSIYWRPQWGTYKVSYQRYQKQIDLTNHEIIDSRFLLETPLDLIQDKYLRNCYMANTNNNYIVRAVSSTRKKVEQLQEIQTLKALLKSMKSNAIDSIPKLRLIWKILTTKNRIQFDINDLQSFSQIPILSRIIKLDQTFKVYLQNINKEVNQDRIIKIPTMMFPQRNLNAKIAEQNLRKMIQIIANLIRSQKENKDKVQEDKIMKQLQFLMEGSRLKCLQQWIYFLNHINNLIFKVSLHHNQLIAKKIGQITSEFQHYQQFLDSKQIQIYFRQLVILIKQSNPNKQAIDIPIESLNSSTFLRDNQNQFQNNIHKIKKMQGIIENINQQLNTFKYRKKQAQKLLLMQYEKNMFMWSNKIIQIIQKMPQNSSKHKFLIQAFRITPWIYKITELKSKKMIYQCSIMSKLSTLNKDHSIHLILNGQLNTELQIINLINSLDNCLGQGKISKITATNFHTVIAFLYAMNLDELNIMQEVMGLWHLVAENTIKSDKKQQNIKDILLKTKSRKICSEQNDQLFINVAKKFPNAFKLLLLIQQKSKQVQNIDINSIYQVIDEFDRENSQLKLQQKQQQIINFLEIIQVRQSKIADKISLVNTNKSMIEEKMKLNKVGIKFLIRFLYRNVEYQENWFKIHTQTFRKKQILHNHLLKMFDKYNINDTITLKQFNKSNKLKIELNFILSNYQSKSYQIFTSQNKGEAKLIDLILSSIAIPIQFGPQSIEIKQLQISQKINLILNKKDHKMVNNTRQNIYWSIYGSNPSPFNLIQGVQQQQICLSFDLTPVNSQRQGQNQRQSLRNSKEPIKNNIEQKENLKAIDLLSMWWTKSKKLTPEMKELLFGAIFQSPFLQYYYFVQNHSYEHLLKKREMRFLVDISNQAQEQLLKAEIISTMIGEQQEEVLGIIKISSKQGMLESIEAIFLLRECEMKVDGVQKYFSDGISQKVTQSSKKLKVFLYKLTLQTLDIFQISIQLPQTSQTQSYLEIRLIDNHKIQITSLIPKQNPIFHQFSLQTINYLQCPLCKRCTLRSKQQECIYCVQTKQKRGNLNMYLLARFSYRQQFEQHKSKIIEEVRQSIIFSQLKEPQKDQSSLFQNICCCFCKPKQQDLEIQK